MHKLTVLISIVLVLIPCSGSAWTIEEDFEGFSNGSSASSSSFVGSTTNLSNCDEEVSDSYAHGGTKSWKHLRGDTRETCAQDFLVGDSLSNGDEVWLRMYLYLPSGFDWDGDSFLIVKLIRFAKSSGYISTLITDPDYYAGCGPDDSDYDDRVLVGGIEGATGTPFCPTDDGGPQCGDKTDTAADITTTGVWHLIEMYVYLHSSNGIVRIWHNEVLSIETCGVETLAEGDSITNDDWNHLGGAWNNTPLGDATYYIDDIVITNEQPSNQDAAGNYMIGGETSSPPQRSGVVLSQGVNFR